MIEFDYIPKQEAHLYKALIFELRPDIIEDIAIYSFKLSNEIICKI